MEQKRATMGQPGVLRSDGTVVDAFGNRVGTEPGDTKEKDEKSLEPPEKKRKIVLPPEPLELGKKVVLPAKTAAPKNPRESELVSGMLPTLQAFLGVEQGTEDPVFTETMLVAILSRALGAFGVDRLLALPASRREAEQQKILERSMNMALDEQISMAAGPSEPNHGGLVGAGSSSQMVSEAGSHAFVYDDSSEGADGDDYYLISDEDDGANGEAAGEEADDDVIEIAGIKVQVSVSGASRPPPAPVPSSSAGPSNPRAVPASNFYPIGRQQPQHHSQQPPVKTVHMPLNAATPMAPAIPYPAQVSAVDAAPLVFETLPPEPALEALKVRVWNERARREEDNTLLTPKPVSVDLDDDEEESAPIDVDAGEPELDVWKDLKEVDLQPPGLKCALLPHQVVGLHWLVRQERLSDRSGGILADDMGLGKTIQTLALILANPPPKTAKCKTTLVVCPLGVLQQWVSEIRDKTFKGTLRVGVHHPSVQKLSPGQMSALYDVVVTSFEMVTRESPHPRKQSKPAASSSKAGASKKQQATRKDQPENERGPLFKLDFYRIILDEAHWVKNPSAERTRAVHELSGKFRWCLSGTPIQNHVSDLYPLFRFLQIPEYPTKEAFDKAITSLLPTRRSAEAMMRLHTALQTYCLRRRKDDKSPLGKPLLDLPKRTVVVDDSAQFSEAERKFYNAIARNTRRLFARLMKRGSVMRNWSNVLVRILRERQAADDCRIIRANFTKKELDEAESTTSYDKLLAKIFGDVTESDRQRELERARKIFSKTVFEDLVMAGKDAEKSESGEKNRFTDACPICHDVCESPMVTKCGHIFCKDCITAYVNDENNKESGCPECSFTPLKPTELVSAEAFYVPPPAVTEADSSQMAIDDAERVQDEEDEKAIRQILHRGPDCGAKIIRLLELLKAQQVDKPGSKAIVFSSFTSMLSLCGKALKDAGIGFARYDGDMTPVQRDSALRSLNMDSKTLVLLVSLKAGGVGLNREF